MREKKKRAHLLIELVSLVSVMMLIACSGSSGQRAAQGGTVGAIAGAAGGVVSALVFGGNVGEAAARGAVWGGTTGAVSGAVVGAQEDHMKKKTQQDARVAKLKKDLGEDAFNGLAALAECKHEVALGYARTAEKSDNRDYSLAGLWVEILTYADRKEEDKARVKYPVLIEKDDKIGSENQAEEKMQKALNRLGEIRNEFNLPRTCK